MILTAHLRQIMGLIGMQGQHFSQLEIPLESFRRNYLEGLRIFQIIEKVTMVQNYSNNQVTFRVR